MQQTPNPWRETLHGFIKKRLEERVLEVEKKRGQDEAKADAKLKALNISHTLDIWVNNAAQNATAVRRVTHTVKATNTDAKGTELLFSNEPQHESGLVSTASSRRACSEMDFTYNTSENMSVISFLELSVDGVLLKDALLAGEKNAVSALSDDPARALELCSNLVSFWVEPDQVAQFFSDTLSKQVYFPVSSGDHLLAPLYPSQLVHQLFGMMKANADDWFAREKKKKPSGGKISTSNSDELLPYAVYPSLLAQFFCKSNPRNVSRLNQKRLGKSFLLGSLPPLLNSAYVGPPYYQDSVFAKNGGFAKRRDVQNTLAELKSFLHDKRQRHPDDSRGGNKETRDFREESITRLMDSLLDFTAELRELAPGWSVDPRCELPLNQRYAFDPHAERPVKIIDPDFDFDDEPEIETPEKDWPRMLGRAFASFLTASLSSKDNVMQFEEHQAWWRQSKRRLQELQKELADV